MNNILEGKDLVENRVTEKELDERLARGIEVGRIPGEQWFRNADHWYSITAYSNPFKTVYTELKLLIENEWDIASLLDGYTKIFYGVGIGDTEAIMVEWDLKKRGYSEVYVIDVAEKFIRGFVQSLKNLVYEYPNSNIMFKGFSELFEKSHKLQMPPKKFKKRAHICLGNTLGNFEQGEIFEIFKKNMSKGDLLVVGIQLNINPKRILMQYRHNPSFRKLLSGVVNGIQEIVVWKNGITWKYNEMKGRIEAWYGGVEIFRSKKYRMGEIEELAEQFGFEVGEVYAGRGTAIYVFEKK